MRDIAPRLRVYLQVAMQYAVSLLFAMGDGKRDAEAIDKYIKTGEWSKEIKPRNF